MPECKHVVFDIVRSCAAEPHANKTVARAPETGELLASLKTCGKLDLRATRSHASVPVPEVRKCPSLNLLPTPGSEQTVQAVVRYPRCLPIMYFCGLELTQRASGHENGADPDQGNVCHTELCRNTLDCRWAPGAVPCSPRCKQSVPIQPARTPILDLPLALTHAWTRLC